MLSDFRIRHYRATDETEVIALWTACNLVVPHNNPQKDIRRKLRINPEWFLIGEQNSLIVATSMAGYEGHRGWINYLAVAPDARRRSIASRMMEEAEKLLRQAGCPKINLQIRSTNLQVIEFYKSIGFMIDVVTSMGKRLEIDEGT